MDLCSSAGDSIHSDGTMSLQSSQFFPNTYIVQSVCSNGHNDFPVHPDDILIPFLPLQHFNYFDQAKYRRMACYPGESPDAAVDLGTRCVMACFHCGTSIIPKGLVAEVGSPNSVGGYVHQVMVRTVRQCRYDGGLRCYECIGQHLG